MQGAIKELYVTRDDIQAIGKRSLLVTPLGVKVLISGAERAISFEEIWTSFIRQQFKRPVGRSPAISRL